MGLASSLSIPYKQITGWKPMPRMSTDSESPPTIGASQAGDQTLTEATAPDSPVAPSSKSEDASLGLRRGDQLFVGVCVIVGLLLLGAFTFRLNGWGQPPIEIDRLPARRYDYQLDVNRASWFEWTLLEGIGEKLARRIVADREANGSFATIEDVQRVPGIGPKTWEQIRPWLTITVEPKANTPAD